MGRRLTDKQKKKITADYLELGSYRAVGRLHNVSDITVKKIVQADPESMQKLAQKKEENTQSVLDYMDTQAERKKNILEKLLKGIEIKAESVDMFTNVKDLATAYGIIFDKEIKLEEVRKSKEGSEKEDNTIKVILKRE